MLNKADPTVNTGHSGHGNTHSGATGAYDTTGTTGGYGNQGHAAGGHLSGNQHTGTTGGGLFSNDMPGPAPNTAGPHKSDMLNKLDPRVDSDLDASKTVGGNKTYTTQ